MKSPERGVEVWRGHLDSASPAEIANLELLLDTVERERAAKFRFEHDRHRFIVAHGLLRHLLSRVLERSTIAFTYGRNGKPTLGQNDGLQFNLSHSTDWAVFALAWKRQIGIDLEEAGSLTPRPRELPAMAERIFSKSEFTTWRSLPDEQARTVAFLRAWTRKEACIKAAGLGLNDVKSIDAGFAVAHEPQEINFLGAPSNTRKWMVHDIYLPIPFACALVVETG